MHAIALVVLAHRSIQEGMGFWAYLVRWLGHFHPMMTSFPIALLIAAALAEVLRLRHGAEWLGGASRWCVILGALTAVVTVPLGWAFALTHGSSWILEVHRWVGTAAGAGAVAILFLSEMSRRPGRGGWLRAFRILLFLAVPLIVLTGFLGGAMVYGLRAYAWNWHAPGAVDASAVPPPVATSQAATAPIIITMTDDDVFKPDKMTIHVGEMVLWKNVSGDTHTVTTDPKVADNAKDVSSPVGAAVFNSGGIPPKESYAHQFTEPGVYKYICAPHEMMGMMGEIDVKP